MYHLKVQIYFFLFQWEFGWWVKFWSNTYVCLKKSQNKEIKWKKRLRNNQTWKIKEQHVFFHLFFAERTVNRSDDDDWTFLWLRLWLENICSVYWTWDTGKICSVYFTLCFIMSILVLFFLVQEGGWIVLMMMIEFLVVASVTWKYLQCLLNTVKSCI